MSEYEASQVQRGIEREIRKQKRTVAALEAVGEDASAERKKLRDAQKAYTDFAEQTGMRKQSARTQIASAKAEREVRAANKAAGVKPSTQKGIEKQREQIPPQKGTLLLTNDEEMDTIPVEDISMPRSVGAAPHRDRVKLPDGSYTRVTEGTQITKVVVFAGKGVKRKVDVAEYLSKQLGGKAENWKHVRGEGFVDIDGGSRRAELHWFENEDVYGRERMKVKRWLDES